MNEAGNTIDWTVSDWTDEAEGIEVTVSRPSPRCTEHPWSYRARIASDVIAMVTPEKLADLQARQVATLKRQLVEAEAKFTRCTQCPPGQVPGA